MSDQKPNIKQIIKSEYIKCSQDPIHFLKKYCYIKHPQKGKILFHLYPYQEKVVRLYQKHDYIIINKARQLGISTLIAGISLHMMIFNENKDILCIATKQDTARNLVNKVKFMYDLLPSWLKVETEENNRLSLKLTNGSLIKATTAASDSGRSESLSMLIIDEASYIPNIEEIWASAQQTMAREGGKCIAVSTPYNTGCWFHRTYSQAESEVYDDSGYKFLAIKLPWYVHPDRDEEWRRKQDKILGDPRIAARELDADFTSSGDTVIVPEWVDWIENNTIIDPVEKRGLDKNLWVWNPADYSQDYMVIGDPSRGDGKDFSGAEVFNIETLEQVAEFKGKLSPKEFGYFLIALATEYNNALLIVENNNLGWATLDSILERGYNNLYYSTKNELSNLETYFNQYDNPNNLIPGFNTSLRLRPLVINKFREYIADKGVVIKSKRLLEEMKVFIWKNGRPEAQHGYNDDLIMCASIGTYLRDNSLRFKQQNLDMSRKMLESINSTRSKNLGVYNSHNNIKNPYQMELENKGKENLTWLL